MMKYSKMIMVNAITSAAPKFTKVEGSTATFTAGNSPLFKRFCTKGLLKISPIRLILK